MKTSLRTAIITVVAELPPDEHLTESQRQAVIVLNNTVHDMDLAVRALEEASRIIDYAQSCIDSDYNRQHVLDRWVGIRATLRKLKGKQG